MPRYDKHTETEVQEIYFRDFDASFKKNPVTGNLATVQNDEDAKRLLRNLILTVRGERHYQPSIGSKIWGMLFENADPVTIELAKTTIEQAVRSHLPNIRIHSLDLVSQNTGAAGFDPNGLSLSITFSLINSTQVSTVSIPLRRVR